MYCVGRQSYLQGVLNQFSPSALNYRFTEKRVLQSFLKIFKICVDETALL